MSSLTDLEQYLTADTITAESIYKVSQKEKALQFFQRLPVQLTVPQFSEWAAENRYYPPGVSVYPGRHDPDTAPHMNEPLNRLHPDEPCTHHTWMKSVQSTATTASENAIGASIKYKLWNMIYLTADQSLARIRSSANIDPMIDNSGLAGLVKPHSSRMKRKTADNTYYKEFIGGIKLAINSYGSIGALKSNTAGFIICDEWDEAPAELKGQGDIQGIIEGRTMGLRNFKIVFISTPSMMQTSRIYKNFMEGDQRYYFVPCPHCGEMQVLELKSGKIAYGLTFTTEIDKHTGKKTLIPETVRYICKFCGKDFHETEKQAIMKAGEWRPTATPIDRKKTSYHISGLMSPEMFLSWERICQTYINTDFGNDILKFKDFVINYKGWPWANTRKIMAWETFRDKSEDYLLGEVPTGSIMKTEIGELYRGPLILFGGVDVQGDRLELHVVGFGPDMESWEIDYKVFPGNPANLTDVCWSALSDWVQTHNYEILGVKIRIKKCAIDCGWNPNQKSGYREKDFPGKSNVIYDFISRRQGMFIPTIGIPDSRGIDIFKQTRISVPACSLTRGYGLYVSMIKELLSASIGLDPGPGAVHFPRYQNVTGEKESIPDEHYKRFLSERYQEIEPGKFGWKKIHERNEQWDTYIYAYATAVIYGVSGKDTRWWMERYKTVLAERAGK